ncbi:hypothetical protein K2173_000019 [Erythroxylum novogranatense]|uniref:Transmembrane protein n=1 Tax=Erythroxylum novogranatense TaxID=1862640 RepID=A0AAV8SPD0_9ROSI|nr:hypothetical protein K2173_000019 [Erythroxylum novogranatense]
MIQTLFICIVLANSFLGLAIGAGDHSKALTPLNRKLGGHHFHEIAQSFISPSLSPSMAPEVDPKNLQTTGKASSLDQTGSEENVGVQAQEFHLKRHHHTDKSVAGGGVILGGLATTFLVAVFCYIKATGRRKADTDSETN